MPVTIRICLGAQENVELKVYQQADHKFFVLERDFKKHKWRSTSLRVQILEAQGRDAKDPLNELAKGSCTQLPWNAILSDGSFGNYIQYHLVLCAR